MAGAGNRAGKSESSAAKGAEVSPAKVAMMRIRKERIGRLREKLEANRAARAERHKRVAATKTRAARGKASREAKEKGRLKDLLRMQGLSLDYAAGIGPRTLPLSQKQHTELGRLGRKYKYDAAFTHHPTIMGMS